MRSIKCVIIGDGAVGKTSLLISYTTNTFPTDYVPTVFDNYSTKIAVQPPLSLQMRKKSIESNNTDTFNMHIETDEVPKRKQDNKIPKLKTQFFKLNLWDTAGQDEYDKLRPLSYPQTDIFIICFSVIDRTSFNNLKDKWLNELKQHANIDKSEFYKNTGLLPVLVVGTKTDLRDNNTINNENSNSKIEITDSDEINKFVEDNKLLAYCECSAMNQTGVDEVFQTAVKAVVYKELEIEQEMAAQRKILELENSKDTASIETDKSAALPAAQVENVKNPLKPVSSRKSIKSATSAKSTKSNKSAKSEQSTKPNYNLISTKITSPMKATKKKSSSKNKKTNTSVSRTTTNSVKSNKKSKHCIIV